MPGLLYGALCWVEGRPLMGSCLTSGGSLRRKTPLLGAILVPRFAHGSQTIAKIAHPFDQVFEGTEC